MSNDIAGVVVIDDFFPDFERVRNHAMLSEFYDWWAPDGELYKRITMLHVPDMLDTLTNNVGGIRILSSGYRLNYKGELPNQAIHSDLGFGTHAVVVYLSEGNSGTAFWEHSATGLTELNYGEVDQFESVKNDFGASDLWTQRTVIPTKNNRAVIYKSNLFHSRFPFEAFGSTPEDGRLIAIAFFNFLEDEE